MLFVLIGDLSIIIVFNYLRDKKRRSKVQVLIFLIYNTKTL